MSEIWRSIYSQILHSLFGGVHRKSESVKLLAVFRSAVEIAWWYDCLQFIAASFYPSAGRRRFLLIKKTEWSGLILEDFQNFSKIWSLTITSFATLYHGFVRQFVRRMWEIWVAIAIWRNLIHWFTWEKEEMGHEISQWDTDIPGQTSQHIMSHGFSTSLLWRIYI